MGYSSSQGSERSITRSGISPGELIITDDAAQQAETGQTAAEAVASMNRDIRTEDASEGLTKKWDGQRLMQEKAANAAIAAAFGQQASRAASIRADELAVEARRSSDEVTARKWDEGGEYRTALHGGIGALTGGLRGLAGGTLSSILTPFIGESIASMNLPSVVSNALTAVAATTIGAIGNAPGAAAGFNQAANNYISRSPFPEVRRAASLENSRLLNACGDTCTQEDFNRIDQQVARLESAANLIAIDKRNSLTLEQSEKLAQAMIDLAPGYSNLESLAQAITGRSTLTGEEINRVWALVGILPAGGILKKIGSTSAEALGKTFKEVGDISKKSQNMETLFQASSIIQKNKNWDFFVKNEKRIQLEAESLRRVDAIINETLFRKNNFTSSNILTADEALSAGQKYLGKDYREIGKTGSGVFQSADGSREFRIDSRSLEGAHAPRVPHVHFGLKDTKTGEYISNNHVPYKN